MTSCCREPIARPLPNRRWHGCPVLSGGLGHLVPAAWTRTTAHRSTRPGRPRLGAGTGGGHHDKYLPAALAFPAHSEVPKP